jgi:DNA polymerase I-like protein with 3'-5' exonuclease and polymerase domains
MISIDSETTGLHYQHGVVPFTFGFYDGKNFNSDYNAINPKTRGLRLPWRTSWARDLYDTITGSDAVVFQNARFDIKALCVAGVFEWEEPGSPDFWSNIIELSHLSHLFDSRDSGKDSSLKVLAPKYLGVDYSSEKALNDLVIRCRNFCKDRTDWKLANEENVPFAASSTKWPKLDMWLPRVLRDTYHDQKELARYMGEDYESLHLVVDNYLKADCVYTYDLAAGYISQLDEELTPLLEMNTQLAHVLWKVETLGLCVSGPKLRDSINVCDEWKTKLMEVCVSTSGIEPGANGYTDAQLRKILFDNFGMKPLTYTEKKQLPQVNAKTLLKLKQVTSSESPGSEADRFLAASLAYTKYETKQKYLQSYNKVSISGTRVPYNIPMKDQVFLFPSLKDTGTGTTRFSSNDPNSQNIEKAGDPFSDELPDIAEYLKAGPKLRECFTPPPGHWWFPCDYSQLQLRIFAAATQEPQLIQAFRDGWDFHDFIAHVIFDLPENAKPTTEQRRIAKNCFHPDTECLTRRGWVRIGDLTEDDEVMQADPSKGRENVELSWTKPTGYLKQKNQYSHLLHFKSEGRDLRVTPDHRMLGWQQMNNLKRDGKEDAPVVKEASDLSKSLGWSNAGTLNNPLTTFKCSNHDIQMAVAIQADGSFSANRIRFGFTKKRKAVRLRALCEALGVEVRETKQPSAPKNFYFSLAKEDVINSLQLLEEDKTWKWEILSLTIDQRTVLLAELEYWDGAFEKGRQTQTKYFSSVKKNLDIIQAMSVMTNRKTAQYEGLTCGSVSIKNRSWSKGLSTQPEKIPYTGEVVCISVPTSFLVVRDKGIPTIQGNCNFGFIFGASEKKIDATCGRKGLYSYLMEMFPNAHDFIKETKEKIQDTGVVHTLGGYPLHIPLREFYGQMSYAAHSGVNYIVQGTEGEIVKRAMYLTDQYLTNHYPEGRLAMQIHDEIVFQLPARPPKQHVRNLCKLMEEAGSHYGVETPVDAEVCFESLAKKRNVVL